MTDDAWLTELLEPLARVEPVMLRPRRQRKSARAVAALVAVALASAAGLALAGGVDPLLGIGAAHHRRTASDLDPSLVRAIDRWNAFSAHTGRRELQLIPSTARLLTRLSNGEHIYAVATEAGDLCVLNDAGGEGAGGCGPRLSPSEPTTISSQKRGPHTPLFTYGVARDDIVSVSFRAGGAERTVPVHDNVWFYVGDNAALRKLTVHRDDGSSETLVYSRPQ